MRHGVKKMMAAFIADKRRRRRLTAFVTALSLLVTVGVFLELMQPVVTMTPDPICGKTEHSHSSVCYERALACDLEADDDHAHDDSCYKSVLVCGLSDHEHSDACYPAAVEEPTLAVQLETPEETQASVASDADANTNANAEETQSSGAGDETVPAKTTADVSAQTASTETTSEPESTVPSEESTESKEPEETSAEVAVAIRNLSLVEPTGKNYVGQTLSWNYETSGAAEAFYIITSTDGAKVVSGTADAGMISWTADRAGGFVLTLIASNEGKEASAESEFSVEEAAELSASVSADVRSCFAGDSVNFKIEKSGGAEPVVCRVVAEQSGETIAESDTYLENFTVTTSSASNATTLRVKVELIDALGNTAAAECEIPCAVHKEESRSQWGNSARISATGVWTEDLIAVAKTQIGYRESDVDFIVDEDGTVHGYTRYGDWYGAKYGEWRAAFASFCLHYAGISESEFPRSNDCGKWISRLNGRGLYASAYQYEPEAGDLIFLDGDNDGEADCVGVVVKASGNTVYSVKGDSDGTVRESSYALNDGRICGYGLVSLAYAQHVETEQTTALALLNESADEYTVVFDVNGTRTEAAAYAGQTFGELTAPDVEADGYRFDGWFTDDGMEYIASTTISANVTLYAKYTKLITISFVISDSNYTCDPSSGYTHVTVKSADGLNDDGFTYEKIGTGDSYRVYGTGTLYSCAIPSGESLADNALALLKVGITNQHDNGVDSNTYSYLSVYSWIDGNGKVCSADTAFTEDTELYLRLYADGERCDLNYVCCEDCSISVNYALSEAGVSYPSASVPVGGSVAAEYIPSAQDVNAYFNCETCKQGASYGKVLDYWYILDQNGNQVVFTDGVKIEAAYLPSSGHAITVYAAWKEAPQTVSAAFNNADGSTLSSPTEIAYYSKFSDVKPDDPTLDGCVFVGWTTDGGDTLVSDDAVITTDSVFTAVYDAAVTVRVPDVANNDLTAYIESSFTVRTGKSLADALDAQGNGISAETVANGYLFTGWLVSGDTVAITDLSVYSPVCGALTVTAQYTQVCSITFCYTTDGGETYVTAAKYYVKTNDSIYGAVDENGAAYKQIPTLHVAGYVFNCWEDENGNQFIPSYYSTYAADKTYYAKLTRLNKVDFYDGEELLYTAYAANNAALSTAVDADGNAFSMPVLEKNDYIFEGWADDEGSTVTEDAVVSGDMSLKAQWKSAATLSVHFVYGNPADENAETVEKVYYLAPGSALSTAVNENGEAIGESLQAAPEYVGYEFDGWYYKVDDSSNAAKATPDMVITSETYFTANYTEIVGYTLAIHDIAPNGDEYGEESVDFFLALGDSARKALKEHSLHDGVNAADCVWYTVENGEKSVFDIDSALNADADIYTYTYCLTLGLHTEAAATTETARLSLLNRLFPSASAEVEVTVNGNTLTVTAREGDVISADDFVIDGVDYAMYTWTYTDANGNEQTLALTDLIGRTMTEDFNVTAAGTAPTMTTYSKKVNFYAFVDEQRVLVKSETMQLYKYADKRCLTANQLESVYSVYGLKASDIRSGAYNGFAQTNEGNTNIWQDAYASAYGNIVMVPTLQSGDDRNVDVYYLPNTTSYISSRSYTNYSQSDSFYTVAVLDEDGYEIGGLSPQYGLRSSETVVQLGVGEWKYWATASGEDSAQTIEVSDGVYTIAAANMTRAYTFKRTGAIAYSVKLADDENVLYTADEVKAFNEAHREYPVEDAATNESIELKSSGKYFTWSVEHTDGTAVDADEYSLVDSNGTTTITFAEIARSYVVRLKPQEGVYRVKYVTTEVSAEDVYKDEGAGVDYTAAGQEWPSGNGPSTVVGRETPYTVPAIAGDKVLAPDTLTYTSRANYGAKGDILFSYSFWYWEVTNSSGNTHTLEAGETLTEEMLSKYAVDEVVTLTARYSLKENAGDSRFATCAFYVIVDSRLEDVGGEKADTPAGNYSDALYTTKVYGDQNSVELTSWKLIYASEGSTTATQVDAYIRALDSTGYAYNGKTVWLANVPSDEYCLSRLRTWAERGETKSITLNGTEVSAADLTTQNYIIRWFVFKYENTDGWHVDGLLVPRQGKLTVTKTFDGEAEAIEQVKESFTIDVSKGGATAYTLNLNQKTDDNAAGYTAYDSASDTYTWVIDVDQTQQYLVKENNYQSAVASTTAEYRISNSQGASSGYAAYPADGVKVTAYAYATDVGYSDYQTVHLRNTYVSTGTLMLRKSDVTNGAAMANVSFTLYRGGEIVQPIYQDGDDYYLYTPTDATGMTEITNGAITTNASGYLNLIYQDEAATYTLKESVPAGYKTVEDIVLKIDQNGGVTLTEHAAATLEGSVLTVTNAPETTDITVTKVWPEGETPKVVKVRLMYDGKLISEIYAPEATLNADNGWTYTWENQPLYLQGEPVKYTVRETWIGDSAWSADVKGDGFEDYVVTVGSIVYSFADGATASTGSRTNADGTTEFASSASITVTNETYKGQVQFVKVDEDGDALSGAAFTLYSDEECTASVSEANSGANGQVNFGQLAAGSYYIKETGTPEGYEDNDTLYRVTVTSTGTKMEYQDGEGNWVDMTSSKKITNEKIRTANLTILKVDEHSEALSGATFQLQAKTSSGSWQNQGNAQTTGSDGRIDFEDLQPGTYQIVETKAPDGYYKLTDAIGFTVSAEDGSVTLSNTGAWTLSDDGATLTVANHTGSELPKTGGRGTFLYTMGGMLLMAASLLCGLNQRRRREKRRWTT